MYFTVSFDQLMIYFKYKSYWP